MKSTPSGTASQRDPHEGTGTYTPCERFACYLAPDGSLSRVPLPSGVTPRGLLSVYGSTRLLIDVIGADDVRTDADIINDQVRRSDVELDALIADGLALGAPVDDAA